ncbi:XdhC family protein [candidate division CSSED10-310 bacterium]|uniref:XdhC family protein n=1 Tax=candidate division CSSED10-310 bacterium TaxID=2855610 RepID=A0ABV6YU45_UNCC1
MDIFSKMAELIREGTSFALCIVTHTAGSTPRKTGAKMLVFPDRKVIGTIGGGALEENIISQAISILETSSPQSLIINLKTDLEMICGGSVEVYIEPFSEKPRLIIFGAGHIGEQLVPLGRKLGFRTIVVDERTELLTAERFPAADDLAEQHPLEFIKDFSFQAQDHLVIITHKHSYDQAVLQAVVQKPVRYIGMIGSRNKVKQTFEKLSKNQIEPAAIERVHAPIGLGIKAETPTEIAILIAAELVQQRYTVTDT